MVLSIFFGRYILSRSPIWGEPFSLLCLVWISLLGSALAVRNDEHLRVTMFDEKPGKKGLISTEILSTACIVVFSVFLIYYGSALTHKGAINNMAGINVPYSVMYISLPVTGVLNLGIGLLTPPVGSTLFIGSAISNIKIETLARRMIPFYLTMAIALLIMTYFPESFMWLPDLMFK